MSLETLKWLLIATLPFVITAGLVYRSRYQQWKRTAEDGSEEIAGYVKAKESEDVHSRWQEDVIEEIDSDSDLGLLGKLVAGSLIKMVESSQEYDSGQLDLLQQWAMIEGRAFEEGSDSIESEAATYRDALRQLSVFGSLLDQIEKMDNWPYYCCDEPVPIMVEVTASLMPSNNQPMRPDEI